jgi:glycyl-tRNA synthetase beta chain
VRAIAKAIGQQLGGAALAAQADQAAELAKTDLVTDMVGEFPELQGIMGRYYALNDGLAPEVADAIEDHYKPRFAGDELPRSLVGLAVALADKLETLVGMFGIGNLPTGDKDPFALRRHALGVVRMLADKALPLNLDALVQDASRVFGDKITDASLLNVYRDGIRNSTGVLIEGAGHVIFYDAPQETFRAISAFLDSERL